MAESRISPDFLEQTQPKAPENFLDLIDFAKEKLLEQMRVHKAQPVYVPEENRAAVKLMTHTTRDEGLPFISQRVCGDLTSGQRLNPLKMMSSIDRKEYLRYPPGNNPIQSFPAAKFYNETKHCQRIVQSLKTIAKEAKRPVLSAHITEEGSNEKIIDVSLKCDCGAHPYEIRYREPQPEVKNKLYIQNGSHLVIIK